MFSVLAYVLKIKIENFYVVSPMYIKIFAHIRMCCLLTAGAFWKDFSCFQRIRFFISKNTIISFEKQNLNLPCPFLSPCPTSSHPSHWKSHTHFFPEFDFPSSKKEDFVDTKFLKWDYFFSVLFHFYINQSFILMGIFMQLQHNNNFQVLKRSFLR